jgi:hypothetical protein
MMLHDMLSHSSACGFCRGRDLLTRIHTRLGFETEVWLRVRILLSCHIAFIARSDVRQSFAAR